MPHAKSCRKRLKTAAAKRLQNRDNRAYMRGIIRTLHARIEAGEAIDQKTEIAGIQSLLDVQARKGVIPRKRASRLKSRLAALISSAASS